MTDGGNVLLITIDQLTAEALDGPLAAAAHTPALDRLAASGTVFENHFTVTVPCGPARASLLTGLYAMNHRAIRNGTPLAGHHVTLGTEARKAGYEPLLFGYSDVTPDPTWMNPEDPDLRSYEGVAPGFRELVEMRFDHAREWPADLRAKGYPVEIGEAAPVPEVYRPAGDVSDPRAPALYRAEDSDTAYLTNRTLAALDIRRNAPWMAHLTYLRPHPPLIAPEPYNTLVDPADVPMPVYDRPDHPFLHGWFQDQQMRGLYHGFDGDCAALSDHQVATLRAVYLGLLAEVDHHVGRILDWLDQTDQAGRTLVILTADHGEMLGHKRMWGKESMFDPALRVPLIIRDPASAARGQRVSALTESVDLAPTVLRWLGRTPPEAMDGHSLLPLLRREDPPDWRRATFHEMEFGHPLRPTRIQRHMGLHADHCHASVLREARWKYVHFAGGVPPLLFDLDADPHETTDLSQTAQGAPEVTRMARALLDRMIARRDRRLTGISIGA